MTTVLYDDVNGRADVIVSHDGLCKSYADPAANGYSTGYAATLFRDGWWSGGCSPIMDKATVEQLVTDQNAYAEAAVAEYGDKADVGLLTWEGDTLVLTMGTGEDAEVTRSEPTPDGYDVGFGWTWAPVDYSECDTVVGDAPRLVTVQFTYPQSLIEKYGEDDLVASVQARMEEFYVGPDNDEFVTGHVAVSIEP